MRSSYQQKEAQFDSVAKDYDKGMKELLGPYMYGADISCFAEYKIQLLHCLLKKKKIRSVLDFGCGTGRSLMYLKECWKDATDFYGCDVSSESIKIAQTIMPAAHLFVNATVKDFDNFFKGGGSYDLVFLACVLHHIKPKERRKWMKAAARYLNQGGCIAVFEHNLNNPYTKKIVLDAKNTVDQIDYMLTQKEVCSLLLSCSPGMKLVWKGYTLFSPYRTSWMIMAEAGLKWCPLGAQHCVIVQKLG